MAKMYFAVCDDGFRVESSDKKEAANMMAMHILTMHPANKMSGKEVSSMVEEM